MKLRIDMSHKRQHRDEARSIAWGSYEMVNSNLHQQSYNLNSFLKSTLVHILNTIPKHLNLIQLRSSALQKKQKRPLWKSHVITDQNKIAKRCINNIQDLQIDNFFHM